jgi:adenosylcobinamide-phosphate synthase
MGDSGTLLLMVHSNLLVLLAGYAMSLLIGGVLYAYLGRPVARKLRDILTRTGEKLNQRSISVRVWRGVVLVGFLLFFSLLLGGTLGAGAGAALLIAIFTGIPYPLWWAVKAVRAAKRQDDKALQHCAQAMTGQEGRDYHGTLRIMITGLADHFTLTLIGGAFWFVLLGAAGWFGYLALAAAARAFPVTEESWRAFGWAPDRLFRLTNALPVLLGAFLVLLASLLVPKISPVRGLRAFFRAKNSRHLHLIAGLLNITLGGPGWHEGAPTPHPWIGEGRAQIEPDALLRMVLLYAAALILLMVFLLFIIGL